MKRPFKIGTTFILALLIVYVFFVWVKMYYPFSGNVHSYNIEFSNVNGLLLGAPVNIRGYKVGKVSRITPSQQSVQVTIDITEGIPLFQDAHAIIQIKELMGGKQIELLPGEVKPLLPAGALLKGSTEMDMPGAFSTIDRTMKQIDSLPLLRILENIDAMTAKFSATSDRFEAEKIVQLMDMFLDLGTEMRSTLVSVNEGLHQVKNQELLQKSEGLMEKVEMGIANLNHLIIEGSTVLKDAGEMTKKGDKIAYMVENKTIPQTDSLMQNMENLLGETATTLAEAQSILKQTQQKNTTLNLILNDTLFATKLDSTLNNINSTFLFIRENRISKGLILKTKKKRTF
jgi:phospholipid/cholesterol/gamma-HCH transport system substrate-binding protein